MSWVFDSAFSISPVTASFVYDNLLYVANEDYIIRVWNIQTQSLIRKLVGHTGLITGIAYIQKSDLLMSCSIDGSVITWFGNRMVHNYKHFLTPRSRFPSPIYSICYSDDDEMVVIGLDGVIVTFTMIQNIVPQMMFNNNVPPFTQRQSCKIHNGQVNNIVIYNRRVCSAAMDRTIAVSQLLDITINKLISTSQDSSVTSLIVDPVNGNYLSGDHSGTVRIHTSDGLCLGVLISGLGGSILSIHYDTVLNLVWIVSSDGNVSLVDPLHQGVSITENFQIFKLLPATKSPVHRFEWISGNKKERKIVGIVDHTYLFVWRWSNQAFIYKVQSQIKPAQCLCCFSTKKMRRKRTQKRVNNSFIGNGTNVFVGGHDIMVFKPNSEFVYSIDSLLTGVNATAMDFNKTEICLLIGTDDGHLIAFSFSQIMKETVQLTENAPIRFIFTYNSYAVIVSDDWSAQLIEIGDEISIIQRRDRIHDCSITACAFSARYNQMLTCDESGMYRLWKCTHNEVSEMKLIDRTAFGTPVSAAYSSSNDSWIIATKDFTIRAYSACDPSTPPTFTFYHSPCQLLSMTSGGDNDILVALDDMTIRDISLLNQEEKHLYQGHTDNVIGVFYVEEEGKWVSVQCDGTAYFWRSDSGESPDARVVTTRRPDSFRQPTTLPRLTNTQPSYVSQYLQEPVPNIADKIKKVLWFEEKEKERALAIQKRAPTYRKLTIMQNQVLSAVEILKKRPSNKL